MGVLRKRTNLILAVGLITNIFCNVYFDITDNSNIWFLGNAIALFCYSTTLYLIKPNIITSIILGAVTQQLIDELINDPTKNTIYEYIGFIVFVVLMIYGKNKRNIKGDGQ